MLKPILILVLAAASLLQVSDQGGMLPGRPCGGTPAALAATVTWTPDRPLQGHLFLVRVAVPEGAPVASVTGTTAGEPLNFARTADGAYESPAPIPVEAEGLLELFVMVHYEDGSEEPHELRVPVAEGSYRHERLTVAPELGRPLGPEQRARLARDQEKARAVAARAHATPPLWTSGEVVLPRRTAVVTSGFGNGRVFNGQVSSRHMGLDLRGAPGDTVLAAARGVVALVDSFLLAGDIVYLNHGGGLHSGYFHLSEQLVSEGDTVEAGSPIGRVGTSGRVTGPHLHWVVRYGAVTVDPRSFVELAGAAPATETSGNL